MKRFVTFLLLTCLGGHVAQGQDDVLFADNFDSGLSDQWQIVGLTDQDYRIQDGGLELRVQPSQYDDDTPRLRVILPFTSEGDIVASVKVTLLDEFTAPEEFAGLFLIDEHGGEFRATKQRINGELFYSPPSVRFLGKSGGEGDLNNYSYTYRPAYDEAGPLRILVRNHYAYFQVGPSTEGKYLNFFFSAIRKRSRQRGFALIAAGAAQNTKHWVRFDDFKVFKR